MYSQEVADAICARLAEGESLRSICQDEGMPNYSTVRMWETTDPEFLAHSTRAREIGCHVLAEECLEIADTPAEGVEKTIKPDGSVEEKHGDMLGHRKLRIETRMRLLGKWLPRVYGDKVTQEISGPGGLPIAHHQVTAEELAAAVRSVRDKF